jgi:PAS domain S-box-containing protein
MAGRFAENQTKISMMKKTLEQTDRVEIPFLDKSCLDLVENASDAIYVHDVKGNFTFVNRKAEELTGYSREEMLARHFSLILEKDGRQITKEILRKHQSLRGNRKFEISIKNKTGELIPVELSLSPLRLHKKLIGFEGIARDIRERKKTEKLLETRDARIHQLNLQIQRKGMELEDSSRIQTEFVANVSHEFRTPLNAIIGYAELLSDEIYGSLNKKQSIAMTSIRDCATELLNMVQDILDLSKLKNNTLKLEYDLCSPHDLVETTLGTVSPIARSKGLKLKLALDKDLPAVRVDFKRIYQAFVNLAENAVKFTSEGEIEIGAVRDLDNIKFYVRDTGIGISSEQMEAIFHDFRQGNSSNIRSYNGIGLGLSLSKRLVELHQGEIGVDSKLNDGSVFYFKLPLQQSR